MAVSKKFTKQKYREWLQSYSPKSKVGFRTGETPIERYMAHTNLDGTEIPQWAVKYTQEIQNHPSGADSICANVAIKTLDAVR